MYRNIKSQIFPNLHGNMKLQVFPELKLYAESPKLIVDKCVVANCSTSYKSGQKEVSLHFQGDQELKRNWVYFVNRRD